MSLNRRGFLATGLLGGATGALWNALACLPASGAGGYANTSSSASNLPAFDLEEITVRELQKSLASGKLSARSIARKYLERIKALDRQGPTLRSVIEINPDALELAARLDRERQARRKVEYRAIAAAPSGPPGPLQGIPVLIKDNIDTHDRMSTTAGSLALSGSVAPRDAFLVEKLRSAGAIILGKTNLSEWANFRGSRSISGWSGRGGQTRNPYVLDRNPSGSSSGSAVAVAANFCAAAVGTETDGSIISPSSMCGIVGLKPTVGLVSRAGVIPISSSQDTAGPMARTVTDVALLLGALAGGDPRDPATAASAGHVLRDYTADLSLGAVRGLRLGVLRKSFSSVPPLDAILERSLASLREAGAILVDPVEIPKPRQLGDAEYQVMLYEFKAGLNAYFASLGPAAPVHDLRELIEFNERHRDQELRWFGQETLRQAEAKGPLTEPAYREAVETCRRYARTEGIDAVMRDQQLDAFVASPGGPAGVIDPLYGDRGTGGSTAPSAPAGYPCITVPAGFVHELPVAIAFFGAAWSESTLLQIAFAFEQITKARRPPRFLRTVDDAA